MLQNARKDVAKPDIKWCRQNKVWEGVYLMPHEIGVSQLERSFHSKVHNNSFYVSMRHQATRIKGFILQSHV